MIRPLALLSPLGLRKVPVQTVTRRATVVILLRLRLRRMEGMTLRVMTLTTTSEGRGSFLRKPPLVRE